MGGPVADGGCVPDKVIARVVLGDLEERWQKRLDECSEKFSRGEVDADAFLALSQERDREQEAELRAALGDEGFCAYIRSALTGLCYKSICNTIWR